MADTAAYVGKLSPFEGSIHITVASDIIAFIYIDGKGWADGSTGAALHGLMIKNAVLCAGRGIMEIQKNGLPALMR